MTVLGSLRSFSLKNVLPAWAYGLVMAVSQAKGREALGVGIGTDVQAYDATLTSIAALGTAADKIAYTTGVDTWAETALTSFGRSLIDDVDASAGRTTLGAAASASPTITGSMTFSFGSATTLATIWQARPSDYGAGKPLLTLLKQSQANKFTLGAFDTVNNTAVLDIDVSSFTYLGVEVVNLSKSQVLSNKAFALSASVTPTNNGDLVIERTSNTQLTFKLKGSDGTVRSGTMTLT